MNQTVTFSRTDLKLRVELPMHGEGRMNERQCKDTTIKNLIYY